MLTIYLSKNTVKHQNCEKKILRFEILYYYVIKCNLFLWWQSWIFSSILFDVIIFINRIRLIILTDLNQERFSKTRLWRIDLQSLLKMELWNLCNSCALLWSFCLLFFPRKMFQLHNRYVVKQQYILLNTLYFCPSQPRFHSCLKLNMAPYWLRSIILYV